MFYVNFSSKLSQFCFVSDCRSFKSAVNQREEILSQPFVASKRIRYKDSGMDWMTLFYGFYEIGPL